MKARKKIRKLRKNQRKKQLKRIIHYISKDKLLHYKCKIKFEITIKIINTLSNNPRPINRIYP